MGKKVLIIGGGVSGLTTAIYLRLNGYETVVLEKNAVPGGACIGWERKGCYIDGCIHWLVGTNPKDPTYKLWEQIGALSPDVQVFDQNDFYTLDFEDGVKFNVWSDLTKLENELTSFAPEDKKQIKKLCKLLKIFGKITAPIDKPVDLMNLLDLLKVAFTMAGTYYHVNKASKISCASFAEKFKNPYIKKWIKEHLSANYNFMSFLYMLGHVVLQDGGIPEGGSKGFVERICNKYLSTGGQIRYNVEVEKVNVENNVAVGVTLKNGEVINADWVVSSVPIEHLLHDLLGEKYQLKKISERLKDANTYPIYTYTTVVYKIKADLSNEPLSHKIYFNQPITLNEQHFSVTYRNFSYDKTLKVPEGHTVVQATLMGDDQQYFWWQDIKEKGDYLAKKQELANKLMEIYLTRHPELEGKIEVIDVLTPLTYQRYLNGRHGSFQGFVQTPKGKALMQKGVIKGLKNFILSGQWILRSGGLPPAAITGKWAAQRICKIDRIKFKTT